MKRKYLLTITSILVCTGLQAQTGPGGVGNTSNNGLWLRAGDIGGGDGTPVGTWGDFSGNSNDAVQTDVTRQPTYHTTSMMNNRPVVRLNDGGGTDQLVVTDADILDDTDGLTYYTAIRPNNLDGNPRGILGKRITFTVNIEYAYTWFFWSGDRLYNDIHTLNNRYNSGTNTFSNATNYILSMDYNGNIASGRRSRMYSNGTKIAQATENSTAIPNSSQDLAIGTLNVDYGTYLGADYGEVIQYNYSLDSAEHIIVQNYLSSKFDIAIINDFYSYDNTHEEEVAGIGRVDATAFHDDSQGSALVRINSPNDLGDNEWMFWGHNNASLLDSNTTDVGAPIESRMERTWRVDETGDVGTVTLAFDMSFTTVNGSDLRLLIDRDHDGFADNDVAPIAGTFAGNTFTVTGVNLQAGDYFTVGSINEVASPLPIELLSFTGELKEDQVDLKWTTASEINNDYFTVERSTDGSSFEASGTVDGAGNANQTLQYGFVDTKPLTGVNYYRLKQNDFNGDFSYSETIVIMMEGSGGNIIIYPNPISEGTLNIQLNGYAGVDRVEIFNNAGQMVYSELNPATSGKTTINNAVFNTSGYYFIKVFTDKGVEIQKIMKQ